MAKPELQLSQLLQQKTGTPAIHCCREFVLVKVFLNCQYVNCQYDNCQYVNCQYDVNVIYMVAVA